MIAKSIYQIKSYLDHLILRLVITGSVPFSNLKPIIIFKPSLI